MIAYYRVSTAKQGDSGLGLEGQVADVARHAQWSGGRIIREFREVESGKREENRPALKAALELALSTGAQLVVAKLDRLSRDVHFTSGLMKSQVDFVCCDDPNTNPMNIHIKAAFAEDEARKISERTRRALAAYKARASAGLDQSAMLSSRKAPYKARGWVLGAGIPECRNLTETDREKGRARSAEVRRTKAAEHHAKVLPIAEALRLGGKSLLAIADDLTARGLRTARGKPWNAGQVLRVLRSAEKADAATAARIAATQAARDEARAKREAAAKARWEALQARRAGLTGDDPSPQ